MEKINLKYWAAFFTVALFVACASPGTEVGNPGSKRQISGALASQVNPNGVVPNLAKSIKAVNTVSCPENAGVISVYFVPVAGSAYFVESDSAGAFSDEIDQQERYTVEFRQNGMLCGTLFYAQKPSYSTVENYDPLINGEFVVLGKGALAINLGSITDLGNGVFVSENNPSSYCDDDDDGESDDVDDDDDGDGQEDGDDDDDGYIDWFNDDEDDAESEESGDSGEVEEGETEDAEIVEGDEIDEEDEIDEPDEVNAG